MFCQECGSPLRDTDESCRACGSPVPGAIKSDDSINDHENDGLSSFENDLSTQPDVGQTFIETETTDFVVRKETPEITPDITNKHEEDVSKGTEEEEIDIKWNLSGFPSPRKTEDIVFNWEIDDAVKHDSIKADADSDTKSKTVPSDLDPKTDPMDELNKFFSFEKANEDFQKLLDKQYEKIKENSQQLPEQRSFSDIVFFNDTEANNRPISNHPFLTGHDPEPMPENLISSLVEQTKAEQNPSMMKASGGSLHRESYNDIDDDEDEPEVIWVDRLRQEEPPRQSSLTGDQEDQEGQIDQEDQAEQEESLFSSDRQARIDLQQSEKRLVDEIVESPEIDSGDMEDEVNGQITYATALPVVGVETRKEEPEQSEQQVQPEQPEQQEQPEQPEQADVKTNPELEPLWFETDEKDEEEKKGGGAARAILILIILILVAEASILSIQFLFPNTGAAEKAGQINSAVSGALINLKDRVMDLFGGEGNEDEETGAGGPSEDDTELPEGEVGDPGTERPEGEIPAVETDPVPTADKNTLIAEAAYLNENIATVKANNNLAWVQEKDYGIAGIKNSTPIDDNHWYTGADGTHVYYDKEIVATLMKFDSLWIDYVNGGGKEVISLTKEGSKARKNAETFSKVGKVEQTFLTLEIGEIRRGKDTFYAWTYEEIKEVQGSNTNVKKYNWIYCLEPVGEEMKIVNYYKY